MIHLNIADFAVAIERSAQPALRRRPLIIAPQGAARAVVYDMSDEAFREGVQKAMPLTRALRICPSAAVLPPMPIRYERVMRDLVKRPLAYTPLVEAGTDDGHLFLDTAGTSRLFGPPVDVAWRLNREMKKDFGLDPVWSVASGKLVAKVATRMVKPKGEYIVGPGEEESFLSPLPLNLIPGFSSKERMRFREFNLFRVSQVHALSLTHLETLFSCRAQTIFEQVRGIDRSRVSPRENRPAIQADHDFATDTNSTEDLRKALYLLSGSVCRQLRAADRHGASIRLLLSYTDGICHENTLRLDPATRTDMQMFRSGLRLLDRTRTRRIRIRHMRLSCTRTAAPHTQMSLFAGDSRQEKQAGLASCIDRIRTKFGPQAITPALTLST